MWELLRFGLPRTLPSVDIDGGLRAVLVGFSCCNISIFFPSARCLWYDKKGLLRIFGLLGFSGLVTVFCLLSPLASGGAVGSYACVILCPIKSHFRVFVFWHSSPFPEVAMSLAGYLPPSGRAAESIRFSWTSCVTLHNFAWAVAHGGLSSSALQALPVRAALAVWWSKMDIRVCGEGSSLGVPSVGEGMQDWLVLSVGSGWTPKEVLVCWIFPSFGGLIFDLIRDRSGSVCAL